MSTAIEAARHFSKILKQSSVSARGFIELDEYCERLKAAAKRIAWHKVNCGVIVGFNNPCTCGYDALQDILREAP